MQNTSSLSSFCLLAVCLSLVMGSCQCEDASESAWVLADDVGTPDTASSCDEEFADGEPLANCCGTLPGVSQPTDRYFGRQRLALGPTGCPHTLSETERDDDGDTWLEHAQWDGRQWQFERVVKVVPNDLRQLIVGEDGAPLLLHADD